MAADIVSAADGVGVVVLLLLLLRWEENSNGILGEIENPAGQHCTSRILTTTSSELSSECSVPDQFGFRIPSALRDQAIAPSNISHHKWRHRQHQRVRRKHERPVWMLVHDSVGNCDKNVFLHRTGGIIMAFGEGKSSRNIIQVQADIGMLRGYVHNV